MSKAKKISIDKADPKKLFYFVANVIVFRDKDKRCLILKRSLNEKVHPGKYCVPGGKLEWADLDIKKPTKMNGDVYDFDNVLEKLLIREVKEEAGLKIGNELKCICNTAFIRPDGIPVMMLKFSVKYIGGKIKLEKDSFVDYAWVNKVELKKYDLIGGIDKEIIKALNSYK